MHVGIYDEGYDVGQVNLLLIFSVSAVIISIGSVVILTVVSTDAIIMFDDRHESSNNCKEVAVKNLHKITKTEKKLVI